MDNCENTQDIVVFDVGSTFTKVSAFRLSQGGLAWAGNAQSPTTVQDIGTGLSLAMAALARKPGCGEIRPAQVYSASSAAGGLRMVAMGYMPRVTAKAAKEVAMSAGARVLEVMSFEDQAEYKREMLREIRPDIILLAGGTDGGETASVLEDARLIAAARIKATVVLAGNLAAQPEAAAILQAAGVPAVRVPNVMPTIHELRVRPAREAIHEQFIHQITKARGLANLLDRLTVRKVVPTPGAVLMAAELLAKGTPDEEGVGGLAVVDLGGATTDIHSVLPHLEDLSLEEKGLVLTNDKQPAFRTVEGNLGLRVSARGIVETVGARSIAARAGIDGDDAEERVAAYAAALEAQPDRLAASDAECALDRVLAQVAVEVALKRHAGYFAQQFDPVMGIVPGTPIGRDLREVRNVFAIGGIFAHNPETAGRAIVAAAMDNPGISLLPVAPRTIIDQNYLLYALGVLSQYHPTEALRFAKRHFGLS